MTRHLHIRIALTVAVVALAVAAAASFVTYRVIHAQALEHARETLVQLARTVQRSASIAVYLDNTEIADEVISGLSRNDLVQASSLTSGTGLKVSHGKMPAVLAGSDAVTLPLESPFSPGMITGELIIFPKKGYIDASARSEASRTALTLAGFVLLVAMLITHVMELMFIRPIDQVAKSLKVVVPGETLAIAVPPKHEEDEIGELVQYVNHQLLLVKDTLDVERGLRGTIEALEKRFRMIFQRASIGIFLVDGKGRLIMANPSFRKILGENLYQKVGQEGDNCLNVLFQEPEAVTGMLSEISLQSSTSSSGDLCLKSEGDEEETWVHCLFTRVMDDSGEAVLGEAFIQVIIDDITDRKKREQVISFHADHDPLTHLLNRRSIENLLRDSLEKLPAEGCLALFLIDLDHFKPINDSFGHEAGDRVLVEVARRLKASLRQTDLVARVGGDEFLVATTGSSSNWSVVAIAEKLLKELSQEVRLSCGTRVKVGASIGIALSGSGGALAELIGKADRAMYEVKSRGRCGYHIHTERERLTRSGAPAPERRGASVGDPEADSGTALS